MKAEPKTARTPKPPVEVGSRRWYWQVALPRLGMLITPAWAVIYVTQHVTWSWPREVIAAVLVPWVIAFAAFVVTTRALWRIDVNVDTNSDNPFTQKDRRVLNQAVWITCLGALAVVLTPVASLLSDATAAQREAVTASSDAVFIALLVLLSACSTMVSIHKKAACAWRQLKEARAELEKGV